MADMAAFEALEETPEYRIETPAGRAHLAYQTGGGAERQAIAELVREKGCICKHLLYAGDFKGKANWGVLEEYNLPVVAECDPRCPFALADEIEKRGVG